jgi:hypothetical protein
LGAPESQSAPLVTPLETQPTPSTPAPTSANDKYQAFLDNGWQEFLEAGETDPSEDQEKQSTSPTSGRRVSKTNSSTKKVKKRIIKASVEVSPLASLHFAELFAGEALLTKVMRKKGIACEKPNDLEHGGTNFASRIQVERLKAIFQLLRTDGRRLILHLAPPCSTFSRARDRSRATKLRSSLHPAGIPNLNKEQQATVEEGNAVAKNAFEVAEWASKSLDAVVSLENPASSYMWLYFAQLLGARKALFEDAVVSQCFYGAP